MRVDGIVLGAVIVAASDKRDLVWRLPLEEREWEVKIYNDLLWNMLDMNITVYHDPSGIEQWTLDHLLQRRYSHKKWDEPETEPFVAPFPAFQCDYIAYMSHDLKRTADNELDKYKRAYIMEQKNHCLFGIWDPNLMLEAISPEIRRKWKRRGTPNEPPVLVQRYRAGLLLIVLLQTSVITPVTPGHEPIIYYQDGDTMFTNMDKNIEDIYARIRRASAQKSTEERICTPPRENDIPAPPEQPRHHHGHKKRPAERIIAARVMGQSNGQPITLEPIKPRYDIRRHVNETGHKVEEFTGTAENQMDSDGEDNMGLHLEEAIKKAKVIEEDSDEAPDDSGVCGADDPETDDVADADVEKKESRRQLMVVDPLQGDASSVTPYRKRMLGDVTDEAGNGLFSCKRKKTGLLPPLSYGSSDEFALVTAVSPNCQEGYNTHSGAFVFRATRLTAFIMDLLSRSPWYEVDTKPYKMGDQAIWDWLLSELFDMDWRRLKRLCSYRYRGLTRIGCAYDEAFFKLQLTIPEWLQKEIDGKKSFETSNGTKTSGNENHAIPHDDHHGRRLDSFVYLKEDEGTVLLAEMISKWWREGYWKNEPQKLGLVCVKWFNAPNCPGYLKHDPLHAWSCGDFLWHGFGCKKDSWKSSSVSREVLKPSEECPIRMPSINESKWFFKETY